MNTRIVIAGGGFAGLYAAMHLDKTPCAGHRSGVGREIEQMITLRNVEVLTDQIMRIRGVNGRASDAR